VTAKISVQEIFKATPPKIPVHFFFGDNDWMDPSGAKLLI